MTYSIEAHRRVYDNDIGEFITVRPSPDFPDGNVCLMTEGSGKQYFGEIRLDLPHEMWREIAKAILASCDEAEAE